MPAPGSEHPPQLQGRMWITCTSTQRPWAMAPASWSPSLRSLVRVAELEGCPGVMLAACCSWAPLEEGWQLHPCVHSGHHRSGCLLLLPCSCLGAGHEGIHAPAVFTSGSISQHLPREGPWREIPAEHSWDVQLCFPAPFTLCLPRADCDLRDLQDMQEEEGDTGDSVGLELAQNQPAKPVSA